MTSSIKRRQTLLIQFLTKIGCKPVCIANSGSLYAEFSSQYTAKSIIRISDHLSNDKSYIHVILNSINTLVNIIYRNYCWCGNFKDAKQILYTLIYSKQVVELQQTVPEKISEIVKPAVKQKIHATAATWAKKVINCELPINKKEFIQFGKTVGVRILNYLIDNPKRINEVNQFIHNYKNASKEEKITSWNKFI